MFHYHYIKVLDWHYVSSSWVLEAQCNIQTLLVDLSISHFHLGAYVCLRILFCCTYSTHHLQYGKSAINTVVCFMSIWSLKKVTSSSDVRNLICSHTVLCSQISPPILVLWCFHYTNTYTVKHIYNRITRNLNYFPLLTSVHVKWLLPTKLEISIQDEIKFTHKLSTVWFLIKSSQK